MSYDYLIFNPMCITFNCTVQRISACTVHRFGNIVFKWASVYAQFYRCLHRISTVPFTSAVSMD